MAFLTLSGIAIKQSHRKIFMYINTYVWTACNTYIWTYTHMNISLLCNLMAVLGNIFGYCSRRQSWVFCKAGVSKLILARWGWKKPQGFLFLNHPFQYRYTPCVTAMYFPCSWLELICLQREAWGCSGCRWNGRRKKPRGCKRNFVFLKAESPAPWYSLASAPRVLAGRPSGRKMLYETGSGTEGIDF